MLRRNQKSLMTSPPPRQRHLSHTQPEIGVLSALWPWGAPQIPTSPDLLHLHCFIRSETLVDEMGAADAMQCAPVAPMLLNHVRSRQ